MLNSNQFRIRQKKGQAPRHLPEVSQSVPNMKVKSFLRYSDSERAPDARTNLLNAVVEEHLLKFGHVATFDSFIKEVAEKTLAASKTPQPELKPEELKAKILDVRRFDERASNGATTRASSRTGRSCSSACRWCIPTRTSHQLWSSASEPTWPSTICIRTPAVRYYRGYAAPRRGPSLG
jgi:hypothetical protein